MKEPIAYNITPAKGQALLNYWGRHLPTSKLKMTLFETSLVEEVKQKGQKKIITETELNADFKNLLIHGDCLSACAYLKSQNIKVDLVYIDPPFASGANYAKKIFLRTGNGKSEFENQSTEIGEEIMYGDIWQKEDYLNWLYERLLAIRDILSDTGSIYVHLSWHIGHYAKIILDEVFGEENFKNEIVWKTQTASGMKALANKLGATHDTIFWYSKSDDYLYQEQYLEISEQYIKRNYPYEDDKGFYKTAELQEPSAATLKKLENDGLLYTTKNGKQRYKMYAEQSGGVLIDDVWVDFMSLSATSNERVDYNTQKPETLLERIINLSSNEGMIVADFFCGSGVTSKAANELGRKFITCDVGINAIQTARDRLAKAKAEFDVLKINDGVRLFRNPAQTVAKLFSLLDGYKDRAELGLGEFWDGGMINKRGTFTPVKFIGIDKKLTVELVDVIIEEVISVDENLQEEIKTDKGTEDKIPSVKIIYAYKQPEVTQEYVNKTIKQSKKTGIKAELISLDELLAQKADMLYKPDNAVIEMKQDGKQWKVEIKKFFSSYLKNKIDEFNNKKVKPKQKTLDENGDNGNGNGNGNGEEKPNGKPKIQISESGLELIEAVQFDTTLDKDGVWRSNLDVEDKAGVKEKIKAVYTLPTDKFKMKIRNISGDEIIIDSNELKKK
jgi:adenine-specific DNA-methyltransferase